MRPGRQRRGRKARAGEKTGRGDAVPAFAKYLLSTILKWLFLCRSDAIFLVADRRYAAPFSARFLMSAQLAAAVFLKLRRKGVSRC